MKKMFNKKFFLILGSTILLLVVLSVAMIFLTKENVKTFKKEGYIIATGNEEASTKYYFDEGTSYKTNISSQLVFKDSSGEKVTVDTDNFMHYIDGGIKFLKNGVIMDLNSIDQSTVPYYNITNKSVLEYKKKSYFIETIDKTLGFNNIAGRISDNKYIFAGVNVKLQLAGNENIIEGDYFELTFIEDGIIKVENQEVSYQTTAQNSYILVDDNIKIDLGNKKIYFGEEEKMSLSQMTIDGNENIEIISDEEDDDDGSGSGDGTGEGTGNNDEQTGNDGNNQEPGIETPGGDNDTEPGDGGEDGDTETPGEDDGSGDGSGSGESSKRKASIDMLRASVGVNNISASFIVNDPDNTIKGDLILHITNTDTGKREYSYKIDKTQAEVNVGVSTLSPSSNYILSINEENNEEYDTQYFQKLFKTETLGVSLKKKYVTQDSVAYEVIFEDGTQVNSAKITLNDANYNPIGESVPVTKESNIAYFENLKSNTTYNIVLDDVIMDSMEYNKVYSIYKTTKTLKKTPYLEGLVTTVDDETSTFNLGVKTILDEDESITKYSFYIYDADSLTLDNIDTIEPIKMFESKHGDKYELAIDNVVIFAKKNYRFKVIAEYYDNEKYGEFETILSDNFILSGKPTIEWIVDDEQTTFNTIVGKIKLTDDSCTVPLNGRVCNNGKNDFTLSYESIYDSGDLKLDFDPVTLEAEVKLDGLIADTLHAFSLGGNVDLLDGNGLRKNYLLGEFTQRTDGVEALIAKNWTQNTSTRNDVINVSAEITSSNENESMGESMYSITFNLYDGDVVSSLNSGIKVLPIKTKTVTGNLKDNYYNKLFTINSFGTFEIDGVEAVYQTDPETGELVLDPETGQPILISPALSPVEELKMLSNGQLSRNYTVEIADIKDEAGNSIPITNNYKSFATPALIIMEEEIEKPTINADPIENSVLSDADTAKLYGISYNRKLNGSTIVGYKINATANINRITSIEIGGRELIYYVCDERNYDCELDEAITTKTIDLTKTTNLETTIPVGIGTAFSAGDKDGLFRGHNYVFKLKFGIDTNGDGVVDEYYPSSEVRTLTTKTTLKQLPSYKTYILNSEENVANYKFEYYDIDNALHESSIYYTIDDEIKNTINKVEPEEETPEDGITDEENPEEQPEPETPPVEEPPKELEVKKVDLKNCKSVTNTTTYAKGYLCDFTINELSTDSVYTLKFKKALIKTSRTVEDEDIGEFIFDGKFVYDTNTVTFSNITFENDNMLRIKINEDNTNKKYVDRISAYHVKLSADGVDDYERIYATSRVETCAEESDSEKTYKCILVDYADIKEFKSKNISVKVSAYYDSGIIDNTFTASNNNSSGLLTNQYGYILQTNNNYNKDFQRGSYINFEGNKGIITTSKNPIGIYTYEKATATSLKMQRLIDTSNDSFMEKPDSFDVSIFYLNDGVYLEDKSKKNQSINNKLLSLIDLGSNKNTFKFNSFIPKINVSYSGLVNGAKLNIKVNGVDEEILKNEFQAEDGKYYYYIDIYKSEEDKENNIVYKKEKVEISLEDKGSEIELTGYLPDTKYFFEVSANLLKEKEYKKTLLFDARDTSKYVTTLYNFSTLSPNGIYTNNNAPKASYIPNKNTLTGTAEQYLKRELTLEMLPKTNIGEYQTRYELYDINGNVVLNETVSLEKMFDGSIKARVVKDITPSEEEMSKNGATGYVFGSEYYTMKVFIITDVYTDEEHPDGKAELMIYESPVTLNRLSDPTYSVKRVKASGQTNYGTNDLHFTVTVNDPNRVIKDGKYCVVLLDDIGLPISGISPKCGLSALEINKTFSYTNLKSNTVYTFKVYSDVYTNNFDVDPKDKNREVPETTIVTTNTSYNVAVGNVLPVPASDRFTLSFGSAININNIKKVTYTLTEQTCDTCGAALVATQTYITNNSSLPTEELGNGTEIYKTFSTNGNTSELVIKPYGLSLTKGYIYSVAVKYYIEENGKYILVDEDSYRAKY